MRVAELFAGVGGFRLGLEGRPDSELSHDYRVIWSNQWEPSTKKQHASLVYEKRFGKAGHHSCDIAEVHGSDIPNHDLLVGGFPCQDYSVATTLQNSGGIVGQKGVLWWEIHRLLREKGDARPPYLFLENVDRLLKSPASQRGRDFAIMLASLHELGYAVEWRLINAADYGFPQRRRRVFILAYHRSTRSFGRVRDTPKAEWMEKKGPLADAFPAMGQKQQNPTPFGLDPDLKKVSDRFNLKGRSSPFGNSGVMIDGKVWTADLLPQHQGPWRTLGDVLQADADIPEQFFITEDSYPKWKYLKGAKRETRRAGNGHEYTYSEGGMVFPDDPDKPSRTIITGEGGSSPSRFKHVVASKRGSRRLTPVELERLNGFPDDHTRLEGISDGKRAFFMGNALVVGIVQRIGESLSKEIGKNDTIKAPLDRHPSFETGTEA